MNWILTCASGSQFKKPFSIETAVDKNKAHLRLILLNPVIFSTGLASRKRTPETYRSPEWRQPSPTRSIHDLELDGCLFDPPQAKSPADNLLKDPVTPIDDDIPSTEDKHHCRLIEMAEVIELELCSNTQRSKTGIA